jgi:hypothetical protein
MEGRVCNMLCSLLRWFVSTIAIGNTQVEI